MNDVTVLINQAEQGDKVALNNLIDLIYPELTKISAGIRRKQFSASNSIDTVALVNETWIKLQRYGIKAENRKHFYRIIAKMMRQILINSALNKRLKKNAAQLDTLQDEDSLIDSEVEWMIKLDEILVSIEKQSQRMSDVFHLRYFLGLTELETSKHLDLSPRTIRREWLIVKKIIKQVV
jgi:RNA polymerase sigma factor (TIGR02999 family)